MKLYNHLNDFYKEKFGERVLKIPLDAGFTCPNRDGSKSVGGCIFCSSRGSGDRLQNTSIKEQVTSFLDSFKGLKANKFIAYFQNFSNTYADLSILKKKYDEALIDSRIIGLDIATRSDCIDEDICKLLSEYKKKYFVQIELGLQTSNENTKLFINQKNTNIDFINAIKLLRKYDIDVIVHIMVGLPNETHEDIENTIKFLNKIDYQGLKIHSTYIEEGTKIFNLYKENKYIPISYEYYMDELVYIISHINPNVIIHRITGDPYIKTFVSPEWMMHKKKVLNNIEKLLKERELYQGKEFSL